MFMLEAFEDTSLGNLNTIERDGTLYVPAIETAMILGYRNPDDSIAGKISYEEAAEISDSFQKLLTDMQGKTPPRRDSGGKTELQLF